MKRKSSPAQELQASIARLQEYYDNVLSSLIDGIIVVDDLLRIITFSTTAEQMTGIKSASFQGKNIVEAFHEDSEIHDLIKKTMRTGRSYSDSNFSMHGDFRNRRDIGLATSPLRDQAGNAVGVVVVLRDLSQIKALEERLRRGERLVSLGTLSAGMAHEIRNPLGGIRGATQLLREKIKERGDLNEYTDVIIREVDRLNKIVQGLLDFGRPPELRLGNVNIHQILDRVASLIDLEGSQQKVHFVRNYDPSLPEVIADPDQLIQVFLNLVRNAIDAMEREGRLSLTTRMQSGYRVESGEQSKKGMIAVEVQDEGCGMDPEEMGKVFDPFYTGKPDGVGLGLALCHRIIEEHGGKIDVESSPGEGTTIRVSLPVFIHRKSG